MKAKESILKEDLSKNVSLILHNSFCLIRVKVKKLSKYLKRLQKQRELMRTYEHKK